MKINVCNYLYHGLNGENNERNKLYRNNMFKGLGRESVVTSKHNYDSSYLYPYSLRALEGILYYQSIMSKNHLADKGVLIDAGTNNSIDNEFVNLAKIGNNESFHNNCDYGVSLLISKDIREKLRYLYNAEIENKFKIVPPQGESKCRDDISIGYVEGIYVDLRTKNVDVYFKFITTLRELMENYQINLPIVDPDGEEINERKYRLK